MDWHRGESSQAERPASLDTTSSSKLIYIRKDFAQTTRENMDGTVATLWTYLETTIPKGKYDDGLILLLHDLLMSAEGQDSIMLALADIYEKLEEA